MRVNTIRTIPAVGNSRKININKLNNGANKSEPQKAERKIPFYPKSYSPSFGIDPAILFMIIYEGCLIGGMYCVTALNEKWEREAEREREAQAIKDNIDEIAGKFNVSFEDAKKYHDNYMKVAEIAPTNDGNEIGLNAVMGYGVEKYKLAVDFVTPLVAMEKGLGKSEKIPNGILLYGPQGGGKTYIAQKTCEHLEHFGVNVINVELDANDHEKNAEIIRDAFENGKERYKETGKYTVLNFENDLDGFLRKRNSEGESLPEIRVFLACADECAKNGVSWVGAANNPRSLDSAVLRAGRTDIKIAVGDMKKFAVADTLKYFLIKHNEEPSSNEIDYQKVVDTMEEDMLLFTPGELEIIVENARSRKSDTEQNLTADDLLEEMYEYKRGELNTLTTEELLKFRKDREYVKTFEKPSEVEIVPQVEPVAVEDVDEEVDDDYTSYTSGPELDDDDWLYFF